MAFDSGSDGADGALSITENGPNGYVEFDPEVLGLDADGDGIYHFTTINISANVRLRMNAVRSGSRPVVWLASGDVDIRGWVLLDGAIGRSHQSPGPIAIPGPGGFAGGRMEDAYGRFARSAGQGPGGGGIGSGWGGGAGHSQPGTEGMAGTGGDPAPGGLAYGNPYLFPLVGGSGGGGGTTGGGGAGGGAILIASSGTISLVRGSLISASGANGGGNGGPGSGGAIRLVANLVRADGALWATGTASSNVSSKSSDGRIRIEAHEHRFGGGAQPSPVFATPGPLFPPANTTPEVRIVSVNGFPAPSNPGGSFDPADLRINELGEVFIEIQGTMIPLGTRATVTMFSETGGPVTMTSSPLEGTVEASTAVLSTAIPPGYNRFSIHARW